MTNDYNLLISTLAILLSGVSLLISFKNSRFNQYAKSVELRTNLLVKIVEIKNQISNAKSFIKLIKMEADSKNDLQLYKLVNHEENYERIFDKVNCLHQEITSLDSTLSIKAYDLLFHQLHGIQKELESQTVEVESIVKNHQQSQSEIKNA